MNVRWTGQIQRRAAQTGRSEKRRGEEPALALVGGRVRAIECRRGNGGEEVKHTHTHTRLDTVHALSRSTPNSPAILIVTRISDASDIRLDTRLPSWPGKNGFERREGEGGEGYLAIATQSPCLTAARDYKFHRFLRSLSSPSPCRPEILPGYGE